MIASELMTADPTTVTPETSIAEVWDLMRDLDIRHVPVVEDGAIVGMLSDRDLAQLDMAGILVSDGASALRQELSTPVVRVMTTSVVSIDTETELSEAVGLLVEHKVGALPVLRPDSREVVGILSYIDVLKAFQALVADAD
jgi:acetoin utilization protein AcuB